MLEIKHILNYYLPCKFIYTNKKNGETYTGGVICTVSDYGLIMGQGGKWNNAKNDMDNYFECEDWAQDDDFKIILNHTSDMTSEQKREYKKHCHTVIDSNGSVSRIVDTPMSLHFLFKNGYDAFDLIENGFAIDYSTLIK